LVLLLLQQVFLTAEELRTWGWRIPFVIGALLAIIALVMRRNLHETDDFIASKAVARRESSFRALFNYPREVMLVVGLTMGGTTAFYTYTTYMQKFLKLSVGLTDIETTLVTAASLIFALVLQPIYGALSDKDWTQDGTHLVRRRGYSVHKSRCLMPCWQRRAPWWPSY
jgi:MFS transporter, MHS family, alpha-ketoglutarate permease